jgi:Antibiotic biosynthesis monooxygenase
MVSITAVIRCRAGHEDAMAQALLDVALYVRDAEPDTRAFFVSRDAGDPRVFTTYERFTDTGDGHPQQLGGGGALLRHRHADPRRRGRAAHLRGGVGHVRIPPCSAPCARPSGLRLGRAVCSDLIHQGKPDRGEKEQTQ